MDAKSMTQRQICKEIARLTEAAKNFAEEYPEFDKQSLHVFLKNTHTVDSLTKRFKVRHQAQVLNNDYYTVVTCEGICVFLVCANFTTT